MGTSLSVVVRLAGTWYHVGGTKYPGGNCKHAPENREFLVLAACLLVAAALALCAVTKATWIGYLGIAFALAGAGVWLAFGRCGELRPLSRTHGGGILPALRRQNREVVFRPPRGGRAPGAGRMSALFLWADGARGARDAAKRRKLPLQAAAGKTWPRGRRYTGSSAQAASRAIRQSVDSAERRGAAGAWASSFTGGPRANGPAVAARKNKRQGRAQAPPGKRGFAGRSGRGKGGRGCGAPAGAGATVLRVDTYHIRHGRPISLFRQAAAPVTALVKDGSICYNIRKTATYHGGMAKAQQRSRGRALGHSTIPTWRHFFD